MAMSPCPRFLAHPVGATTQFRHFRPSQQHAYTRCEPVLLGLGLGLGLRPQNSGLGLAFGVLCLECCGLRLAGQVNALALDDAVKLQKRLNYKKTVAQ